MPTLSHYDRCRVCLAAPSGMYSVPTYNGDIVSVDFPLETGNLPVCARCYDLHANGMVATYDDDYRPLFPEFIDPMSHLKDGAGI